jgi:hypothetical protein
MFDSDLITFPQMMTDEFMISKTQKANDKIKNQSLELNLPRINGPIVYNFDHVFLPESR